MSDGPAYTRLAVDERRRRLLELGADLFTRHAYDELSMAKIAKAAGISKALLYHYFPSKEAYFVATLEEKANELQQRTIPDPDLPPFEQLAACLDEYLKLDRGERGLLRQDDPQRGGGAGGAGAAGPRAHGRPRTASSTGSARTGRPHRCCAPRSAAGSASWTARAWTGSTTTTWTGRPCTASCCPRSSPRSSPSARTPPSTA